MAQRFTLWRGEKRIGWFDEQQPVRHHDKVVGSSGFVMVDGDASLLEAMMQTVARIFPGSPTIQHLTPPKPPTQGNRAYAEQAMEPMPPDVDPAVAPELKYSIRSADGAVIATSMIMLEEVHGPPGEGVKIGLPADATSAWLVMFSQAER